MRLIKGSLAGLVLAGILPAAAFAQGGAGAGAAAVMALADSPEVSAAAALVRDSPGRVDLRRV